jgi:hypothetical protein
VKALSSKSFHQFFSLELKMKRPESQKSSPRHLQVFLCHSLGDKHDVKQLFQRLKAYNIDPWLDKEKLLPGQDWNMEIQKAVRNSDVVLICLSRDFIVKEGYGQKEIKLALDTALEKPEGTIYLIPLKLEECELPQRLKPFQAVNYFEEDGFDKLLSALKYRIQSLQGKVESIECTHSSKIEEENGRFPNPLNALREEIRRNMTDGRGALIVRVNSDQEGEEYHLIPDKTKILQSGSANWRKWVSPDAIRSAIVRKHLEGVYAAVFEDLDVIDYLIWKGRLKSDVRDHVRRRGITVHKGRVEEVVFD